MTDDELVRQLADALGAEVAEALMVKLHGPGPDGSHALTRHDLREELDVRDERWREELDVRDERWRAELDVRDERWRAELDLRDERWREELDRRLEQYERALIQRIDDRFEVMRSAVTAELHQAIGSAVQGQTRTMLYTLVGTALSFAAIMFTAVRLF